MIMNGNIKDCDFNNILTTGSMNAGSLLKVQVFIVEIMEKFWRRKVWRYAIYDVSSYMDEGNSYMGKHVIA